MGRPRRNFSSKAESREKREAALLGPEVCSKIDSASEAELRSMLANVAGDEETIERAMKADMDLIALKDKLKTATEGYREAQKRIKVQRRWVCRRLDGMGKDSGGDIDPDSLAPGGPKPAA
jgi:hypothetical protein